MNISELKSVIHEVLNEMNPAHLDAKVTEIKKDVEKLFNENETYVDHDDIENIILSHIKDVSQAESIFEEIIDFADKVAKEQNYISLGSDKYVKKEGSLDEVKRKKLVSLIKESIEEIKLESQKSIEEDMNSLDKAVKNHNKDYSVSHSKRGGYEICGCLPHHFHIRPNYMNSYDVIYMKDGSAPTPAGACPPEDRAPHPARCADCSGGR